LLAAAFSCAIIDSMRLLSIPPIFMSASRFLLQCVAELLTHAMSGSQNSSGPSIVASEQRCK
jgi:hypothetical protein